nr:MAG TPA: hypothetical protein [Caudoviricetes sp.]
MNTVYRYKIGWIYKATRYIYITSIQYIKYCIHKACIHKLISAYKLFLMLRW